MATSKPLIQKGRKDNFCRECRTGCDALLKAVEGGHAECLQKLVNAGADVNMMEELDHDNHMTALTIAVTNGNIECAQILIKAGASLSLMSLECGTERNELLVDGEYKKGKTYPSHFQYKYCYTPLMGGAREGHDKCVELLIKAGADVNEKDNAGKTALTPAARNGHHKSLKLLLKAGAKPDPEFVLLMAALHGRDTCLEVLIKAGEDLNLRNKFYNMNSALMLATIERHYNCLEVLIKAGAKLNLKNKDGKSALMLAFKDDKCVNLLIDAGADVNASMNKRLRNSRERYWTDVTSTFLLAARGGHCKWVQKSIQ